MILSQKWLKVTKLVICHIIGCNNSRSSYESWPTPSTFFVALISLQIPKGSKKVLKRYERYENGTVCTFFYKKGSAGTFSKRYSQYLLTFSKRYSQYLQNKEKVSSLPLCRFHNFQRYVPNLSSILKMVWREPYIKVLTVPFWINE